MKSVGLSSSLSLSLSHSLSLSLSLSLRPRSPSTVLFFPPLSVRLFLAGWIPAVIHTQPLPQRRPPITGASIEGRPTSSNLISITSLRARAVWLLSFFKETAGLFPCSGGHDPSPRPLCLRLVSRDSQTVPSILVPLCPSLTGSNTRNIAPFFFFYSCKKTYLPSFESKIFFSNIYFFLKFFF